MKYRGIFALLLAALLLCGCAARDTGEIQSLPTIPATEAPPTEPAPTETETAQPADFSELVFDAEQDPGFLTVRYLYMNKPMGSDSNYVYSGDSSVYTSPDGFVMLVDTSNEVSGPDVIAQLELLGIDHIDYLVLSHPHADHVGGFCQIADTFPISQVYINGHDYDSATYQACVAKMQELSIPCQALAAGDSFQLGQEVLVSIYGPQPGANDTVAAGFQDANDGSLAMRVTYGASSFWTSGDLYVSAEEALLERYGTEIASDVVKLNHHGKDTSNGRSFAKAMNCLVAVGLNDSVGSITVARRFAAAGAKVFYNACDGAVRVRTAGDGTYQVQTQFLRNLAALPEPSSDGSYAVSRS